MSGFEYSDDNKRYHTYSYYLKHRFGSRVYRVSLDIGAGCPNRCGERGSGGCLFCTEGAVPRGRFRGIPDEELLRRFAAGREALGGKAGDLLIAYLQSGSNTFGDPDAFMRVYRRLISLDGVAGLTIATRADCIDEAVADRLSELKDETYLTVELGLQTIHDDTARRMHRGHDLSEFLHGYGLLRKRGINTGVHIINGLPCETSPMMLETARFVGTLRPHILKIHNLFIEEGTRLAQLYRRGEVQAMELGEYVELVCSQIELIPPETVIARLTGDGDRKRLTAPLWTLRKRQVLNAIDTELARRGSFQGAAL